MSGWKQQFLQSMAALLIAIGAVSLVLILVARPDWWTGLLASSIAVAIAITATVPVSIWGSRQPLEVAALVGVVSGMLRLVVAASCVILAVSVGKYPALPSLTLLIPLYFAVLLIETRRQKHELSASDWNKSNSTL